ncbi:MAG: 16S rRNA (guanine(966)-N(2))-methyltransferase RsmD [Terracidiphilus sp.]
MRIIAGQYRSRALAAPAGMATRPTSDRLRETLFNVLAPTIAGARFLDLYAGSGAVGIEALSRGAAHVVFVERAPAAVKILRQNLERLGITAGFEIYAGSVAGYLRSASSASPRSEKNELVFMDPPYEAVEEYEATLGLLGEGKWPPRSPNASDPGHPPAGLLAAGAVVIAEHRRKQRLEDRYGALGRTRLLEQGDAALSFFAKSEQR